MKAGVILLSLLAAAGAWWWLGRGGMAQGPRRMPVRLKTLMRGAAVGIGVYVVLTLAALLYLALTTSR